jgi:hypothetical protein
MSKLSPSGDSLRAWHARTDETATVQSPLEHGLFNIHTWQR